jgi:outer membrane protein TolC
MRIEPMKSKPINLKLGLYVLRLAALVATPIAAAGCMVGPSYKRPQTAMPATYREATTRPTTQPTTGPASIVAMGPAEIRWWRELGDSQLTDLVEKAQKANYGVAAAEARLREARAARQVAHSLLYPQASIGASALRFRGSDAAIGLSGLDLEDNLFQVGFDAAWAVDVFGGARRGVESAKANEQAVAAARRGVVLTVAAETARAYLELRGVQRQVQIDQVILEQQRRTLAVT